jgi:hypothetical protein
MRLRFALDSGAPGVPVKHKNARAMRAGRIGRANKNARACRAFLLSNYRHEHKHDQKRYGVNLFFTHGATHVASAGAA